MSSKIWKITETRNINTLYTGGKTLPPLTHTYYSDKPPSDEIDSSILSREVTEGTVVWGETKKMQLGWVDV